jgi:hypothetical protein
VQLAAVTILFMTANIANTETWTTIGMQQDRPLPRAASDAAVIACRRNETGLPRTASASVLPVVSGDHRSGAEAQTAGRAAASATAPATVRAMQQAPAQPSRVDAGASSCLETTTAVTGSCSPSKVVTTAPPESPCFETPAAAEVLAMQLPAAALAAGGAQRRPAVLQPRAARQRSPAARQQRSSKQASKGRPLAKPSHQRRTLPPLPPPSHAAVAARTDNTQHSRPAAASGARQPESARPCSTDQAWQQNVEGALDSQMWQQPQPHTQSLPPSLWEAMAALQYGGGAQPQWPQQLQGQKQRQQQRQQQQQQQQQHWLLVPPPTQSRPHAIGGWYDSTRAEPRLPEQQLPHQGIPAYRPAAQHGWPQLQPPAPRTWQGDMYRPQPVSAAVGLSSWGDQVAAAVHGQQHRHGGATSPAPIAWPHRPAPVHSTAISVAPPSMQMVVQPAAAAERQPQQQPVGSAGLWQSVAMSSAAVGQPGDGCWAPWRPAVSQQP